MPPNFNSMFDDIALDPSGEEAQSLSVLLFGLAGSGKSSLAASASKVEAMSPVLFIDAERNGADPIRRHGDTDNLTYVRIGDYETFTSVKARLLSAVKNGKMPYKTVVIDTVDKLQEFVVDHWAISAPGDGFVRWKAAYDEVVTNFFWVLHSSGLNVILTAHANVDVDPLGEYRISPTFEGKKTAARLPSMVNLVGYMSHMEHNGSVIRLLQCEAPDGLLVKKPFGVPPKMANPTFQKIWDANFISQAVAPNNNNNK